MRGEEEQAAESLWQHLRKVSGVSNVHARKDEDGTPFLEILVEAHVGDTTTDCLPNFWRGPRGVHSFETRVSRIPTKPLTALDRDYRDRWA